VADVTRRRTGELLRNLFEILMQTTEGVPARQALAALQSRVQLTDYEKGSYESGGRRFEKIVRFSTVDCVKAGWLHKNKGIWTITAAGKEAYARFSDPESFYREACRLYKEWKLTQPATEPIEESFSEEPEGGKNASITFEEAEEQAWSELESFLREMNPYDFQELVGSLLRAMGFHVAWIAPPGKDGGIDIIAQSDPLGTKPPRIKVQVKRQKESVRVDGVRSFMAVLGDDDVGLFVCTGGFTRDAQEEARTQEKRRLTLMDLEQFFDLWVENYARLTDEARRRMPLRPIWFLAPE
jgi:restriction system protein